MSDKAPINTIWEKFCSGNCNEKEIELIHKWFISPNNRRAAELLVSQWKLIPTTELMIDIDSEEIWQRIILEVQARNPEERRLNRSRPTNLQWFYVAASLFFLLIAGGVFQQQVLRKELIEMGQPSVSIIEKKTLAGQKLEIYLPDGSKVKLNSESQISHPQKFDSTRRVVKFVGEGFFEVKRNESSPFVIHTDQIETEVLGTSFNVRTYDNESSTSVAVASGRVSVTKIGRAEERIVLEANEMAIYNKSTRNVLKSRFENENVLLWKDGIIYFNKTPFDRVISDLERWYGVKFVLQRQITMPEGYTAKFENQSLEVLLMGMSFSADFKYQIRNTEVIIY